VGDLVVGDRWREVPLVHGQIELHREPEARAAEVAPATAVAQERLALLQPERDERLVLVEWQEHRVPVFANEALYGGEYAQTFVPIARRSVEAGLGQKVAA